MVGPPIFFELVLKPLMTRKDPEAGAEEAAKKIWDEKAAPLLAYLDKEIGDREWFVGNRLTIADIAREAGVSTGSVSYALNGKPGVAEDTRERILRIAADRRHAAQLQLRAVQRQGQGEGVIDIGADVAVEDDRHLRGRLSGLCPIAPQR